MPSTSAEPGRGGRGRFATTQWSMVLAADNPGSTGAEEAFARRQGYSTDDAQDLTQGFFTRLIEKGDLGAADRSRGRFRSFLLTACQHFLSNERDREHALKRGGRPPSGVDRHRRRRGRYESSLAHSETPERLFALSCSHDGV